MLPKCYTIVEVTIIKILILILIIIIIVKPTLIMMKVVHQPMIICFATNT